MNNMLKKHKIYLEIYQLTNCKFINNSLSLQTLNKTAYKYHYNVEY